uniref:Uncharacterized protein n=1 Tax=Anguilla anguilla TaxID=7936 RepID=A0A0E9PT25_ANGAN
MIIVNNVKQVYADDDGRVIILDFNHKNIAFRLINVYASKRREG